MTTLPLAATDDTTTGARAEGGCGCGGCGCGGAGQAAGVVELGTRPETAADVAPVAADEDPAQPGDLDVRAVPHAQRHETVFSAVAALAPGEALVLVAPHDPLPLLGQLEAQDPGRLDVTYLVRGPQAWRLRLTRTACC